MNTFKNLHSVRKWRDHLIAANDNYTPEFLRAMWVMMNFKETR